MNIANFSKLLLLTLVLSVGVTACKKTPKGTTPIYEGRGRVPTGENPGGLKEAPGPILPVDPGTRATQLPTTESGIPMPEDGHDFMGKYRQDREAFKQDTVYFDFDRYNVKPGELPKAKAVADYLKGQATDAVLVEGHCDERGTPEYNRALGERRADSIRESLISLGIAADRIHTISYGEDKPVDTGHNEAAWAKNRRGEFVLLKLKTGAGSTEQR